MKLIAASLLLFSLTVAARFAREQDQDPVASDAPAPQAAIDDSQATGKREKARGNGRRKCAHSCFNGCVVERGPYP